MSPPAQRSAWTAAVAAILLRGALAVAYPPLFGGDSVVRLANADRILLSHQLPALQVPIHLFWRLGAGPWAARVFLILASGVAAAGFYRLARKLMPEEAALPSALLFALNPFLVAYSIVPYQEMLMLAGLAWAFACALEGREEFVAGALALACLARYEAWLACPALLWITWSAGPRTMRTLARTALLYGAAPLVWIVCHGGLTPPGSFAVDAQASFERLWRWVYIGWIVVKNSWFALPAAALGAWGLARERRLRTPAWQALLLAGALFALALLFSAHGDRDQPDRFVSAREAYLPLAFVCLLAGCGLARLKGHRIEVGLAMLVFSIFAARNLVAFETAEPHTALAYRAARLLDVHLESGETAVVLAAPIPRRQLEQYLVAAERQGGPEARAAAERVLLELHVEPSGYQRVLVQARFDRNTLRSLAALPEDLVPERAEPQGFSPDWALVWSDFQPSGDAERNLAARLQGAEPAARLEDRDLAVALYRLTDRK